MKFPCHLFMLILTLKQAAVEVLAFPPLILRFVCVTVHFQYIYDSLWGVELAYVYLTVHTWSIHFDSKSSYSHLSRSDSLPVHSELKRRDLSEDGLRSDVGGIADGTQALKAQVSIIEYKYSPKLLQNIPHTTTALPSASRISTWALGRWFCNLGDRRSHAIRLWSS